MPERPPLLFRPPRRSERVKAPPRGRDKLQVPAPERQAERLVPAFDKVTEALGQQRLALVGQPGSLDPETILVLEIAGEVANFAKAMDRAPGLEFLGEQALEQLEPDQDFRAVDQRGQEKRYGRQLYLVATSAHAWRQLLRLWERWQRGQPFEQGTTPIRHLFAQLRELREWDDRDRLEHGGAADIWRRSFVDLGDTTVPFEAELWFRRDERRRAQVAEALVKDLALANGRLVSQAIHPEIDYHGVLGVAPASRLLEAASSQRVEWLRTEGVRLFHAVGQMAAPVDDDGAESAPLPTIPGPPSDRSARLSLLDGLPIANHEVLRGRLRIEDPEDWGATTPVVRRQHGTLMASLVVSGDLAAGAHPLSGPVHVRPILRVEAPEWAPNPREELPTDRLPVDFVHSAVTNLFEGDSPSAPQTKVIVLAIGDPGQQFDRFVSPLARLLDWLAWRYSVLFLVSAGNHPSDLSIPGDVDPQDGEELQQEVLEALRKGALSRRLLSPAEAVNALTIGAAHADGSGVPVAQGLLEPLLDNYLLNVAGPVANGVGRAIKPDIMFPGGRQPVRLEGTENGRHRLSVAATRRPPGLSAAAPGLEGELDRIVHTTGTSGATGLAGHAAGIALERLDDLRSRLGDAFPDSDLDAVLVKASVAHTAGWGTAAEWVRQMLREAGRPGSRAEIAFFLGHGRAHPERTLVADDHRAVLVNAGRVGLDETHTYDVPLPPGLSGVTVERRLTMTLAWLTPINPRHRGYRMAALDLDYDAGRGTPFGDRQEADHHAVGRGTIRHETLATRRAVPYGAGEAFQLDVSCRSVAGAISEPIPYALIASVETPTDVDVRVYDQIREAVRTEIAVPIRA